MSHRYGKTPKGRRNRPGYGATRVCTSCGKNRLKKIMSPNGYPVWRCTDKKCPSNRPPTPQPAEPPQPPQATEVVKE